MQEGIQDILKYLSKTCWKIISWFKLHSKKCVETSSVISTEQRLKQNWEIRLSLGMNLFSSFEPNIEFKVYNSCKYSQITCRTMYITIIQYDPWTYPLQFFFYKKMFQGPKGLIAQMCEVHLQHGNSTTKWRFYTFFYLIILLYIYLFSLVIRKEGKWQHGFRCD